MQAAVIELDTMAAGTKPKSTTLKRLRFFGGGAFSKQSKAAAQDMVVATTPNPEESEALSTLERMLADRILRNKFIAHVAKLEVTPNLCSLVRFCAAVDEYASAKDKTEKKSKGRKINAMFLQSGAMFELPANALPAE